MERKEYTIPECCAICVNDFWNYGARICYIDHERSISAQDSCDNWEIDPDIEVKC